VVVLAHGFGCIQHLAVSVGGHLDLPSDGHEASAMTITNSDQVHW